MRRLDRYDIAFGTLIAVGIAALLLAVYYLIMGLWEYHCDPLSMRGAVYLDRSMIGVIAAFASGLLGRVCLEVWKRS